MRIPLRRSQFVGVLALWLAALLMGGSLAIVPQYATRAQTPTQSPTAAGTEPVGVVKQAEALDARAGRISKLRLSAKVPVRNQRFTVSGSVSTKVIRKVILQRRSGSKWVTVTSGRTRTRGSFTLPVTTKASTVRYRVVAPKTTIAGKRYPRVTSSSVFVRTVGLSPASPIARETVAVSYAMGKRKAKTKRPVIIQRKVGRSWVKVGSGVTSARGAVRATASLPGSATVRIVAPKVKIKKRTYRAAASKSFVVTVARQSIALSMASSATVGQSVEAVVTAAPLRAGRTIAIQQWSGSTWTTVATGPQTKTTTTLRIAPQVAATVAYRAVISRYHGASPIASAVVNVVVAPADPGAPVIAISALNVGVSGTSYEAVLSSSGGTGAVTWTATGLPAGLELSAAGVLSGTPTESGTFPVTFTVTDSVGKSASQTISFTINPAVSVATTSLPDGVVGSDYALTLQAAGGTAPFTWTAEGLPNGLAFDDVNTISGQPTATGTSQVALTVTDHNGKTDSATLNLAVVDPVSITTNTLAGGQVGDDYSQQLAASGGDGTYTWNVDAGSLPHGLSLSDSGAITGQPTAIGSATFTVRAADAGGREATAEFTIAVTGLMVTTTELAEGTVGQSYSQTLAASGGDGSYTWSIASGALPEGLSLSTAGVVDGTPTGSASTEVTFVVTDGRSRTAQAVIEVVVVGEVQVTTSALAGGVVGDDYSVTLAAVGGSGGYAWQAAGLPDGIELVNATLTGVPTAVGTSSVSLTVTDGAARTASATLSLVVGAAVSITTTTLPYALTSTEYGATLAAAGGTAPYTWSATGLPEGIVLDGDTGVLSGTPTAASAGTAASVEFTVTDAHHKSASSTALLAVRGPVNVTASSLPEATVGVSYTRSLAATGGASPYSWSTTSDLPDGMSLSAEGVLSGTPSAAGETAIEVIVTDSSDPALDATATLTLTVKDPVSVSTTSVAEGTVGAAYSQTLAAAGGTGPFSWAITAGSLPDGLSLAADGTLSGTPTTTAAATVALKITDHVGRVGSGSLTVTVKDPVVVTTSTLAEGTVGVAYQESLAVEGGTGPFAWSAEGSLPDGMTLSEGGVLGGTPTTPASGASIAVTVTDSVGRTASRALTMKIAGPLTMTTTALPDAIADDSYSVDLAAAGGSGDYAWSASGLPPGITLNAGRLSGTPTSAGTYQVSVSVSDEGGRTVTDTFALVVGGSVAVSTTSLPNAVTTMEYSATLAASGGAGSYTWAVDQLPAGLQLDAATGAITGMPTNPDDHTMSVQVTVEDAHGKTASAALSITVLVPVAVVESMLPEATVGSAYDVTLTPGGGTASYTWSTASTLPEGMAFSSEGRLSGTPSESGSFDLVVEVIDSSTPQLNGSATLTLTVAAPVTIVNATLSAGTVGQAYEQNLASSGGTSPLTWEIASGTLPAGVSLTTAGLVSGTPTVAGDSVVTVRVSDHIGRTATQEYTIVVKDPVSVTTTSLADGTVSVGYSQSLTAAGGDGSYTWSISDGSLPAGLSLGADGAITGTPTSDGQQTVTFAVTDGAGRSATAALTIAVAAPLVITTAALDSGVVDEGYSLTLAASGGAGPYTWQATDLPAGLVIDQSTGTISGTPSASGTTTVSISVSDTMARSAAAELSLVVAPVVDIATTTLSSGVAQASYSMSLSATGGTGPYTWTATGLPSGLSISSAGAITGTPDSYGSSTITVTVTDAHNKTSTRDLPLYIEGVVSLAGGGYHMCALLASGGVKCWGSNAFGQLGDGTKTSSSTPVVPTGLSSGVSQVSAMGNLTCALLNTGAAKCWGENTYGQVGDGTTTDQTTPTQVATLTSGVTAVAAGLDHACALVAGSAKCWGRNALGQLGDGTTTARMSPTQVSTLLSGVTSLTAGTFHNCAISSGALKCWGSNIHGQLGDNSTTQRNAPVQVSGLTSGVTDVTARLYQTCAVVSGAAKCWGFNDHSQLGDGTTTDRTTPTQVSGLTSGVTAVTGGQYHTCAIVSGAARCWGYNADGRLGDGTTTDHPTPNPVTGLSSGVTVIANGTANSCAIQSQKVKCWGLGTSGQLGDGTVVSKSTPTLVSQLFTS